MKTILKCYKVSLKNKVGNVYDADDCIKINM